MSRIRKRFRLKLELFLINLIRIIKSLIGTFNIKFNKVKIGIKKLKNL